MTNPFIDFPWAELKTLHQNAIDSVVDNCAVVCQIIYPPKKNDCPNCIWSPSGKSTNKYQAGGPIPFSTGVCPYCNGAGVIYTEPTENINACVFWSAKDWLKIEDLNVKIQNGMVQTWSHKTTYPLIKRAKELIIDTSLSTLHKNRYTRAGEPWWCGFGESRYCVTMWQESGSGS